MRAAIGVSMLAAPIMAHGNVVTQGDGYRGPLLVLDHLFALILVGALLALCFSAGRQALRRLGVRALVPHELAVFATAVGAGIIATILLVLGLLALLRPAVVLLLFATGLIGARHDLVELSEWTLQWGSTLVRTMRPFRLAAAATGVVALLCLPLAIAPVTDWDSLMYHLRVVQQFLDAGRVYLPDDNFHVAFVGLAHMLYVPLLAARSTAAPAVLSLAFLLLLAIEAAVLAGRLFGDQARDLALLTFFGNAILIMIGVTPRIDVTLALLLLLGHDALLRALANPEDTAQLRLAAILLAFASGTKYHALPYAAALVPLLLTILHARRRRGLSDGKLILVLAAIFGCGTFPWVLKNLALLSAPFYPFLSPDLVPPWLARITGVHLIPATVPASAYEVLGQVRNDFNLWDFFFNPADLTVEVEAIAYFPNPILLLLPFSILLWRDRRVTWLGLPALLYALAVVVVTPRTNLRYLIPSLPPLTILAVFTAMHLRERFRWSRLGRMVAAGAPAFGLVPAAFALAFSYLLKAGAMEFATGRLSVEAYLDRGAPSYAQLKDVIAKHVPPEAQVLLLLEARGYGLEARTLQDNVMLNWPTIHAILEDGCLPGAEVPFVLVNKGVLEYFESRGMDAADLNWKDFDSYAARCLELVDEGPWLTLYRSRAGGDIIHHLNSDSGEAGAGVVQSGGSPLGNYMPGRPGGSM